MSARRGGWGGKWKWKWKWRGEWEVGSPTWLAHAQLRHGRVSLRLHVWASEVDNAEAHVAELAVERMMGLAGLCC